MGYFVPVIKHTTRIQITGHLSTVDIKTLAICRFLSYLQTDLSGVLLTDHMEHAIAVLSKGHKSLWTVNDLKLIDP